MDSFDCRLAANLTFHPFSKTFSRWVVNGLAWVCPGRCRVALTIREMLRIFAQKTEHKPLDSDPRLVFFSAFKEMQLQSLGT